MPDPMDTDALRDLQALSGGILSRNLLEGSGVWKINRDIALALGSAADELDRLRDIIAEAPHDPPCPARLPATFTRPLPCTCWKADAP